jgi:putative FmdB family regulatory protein
MPKYEFMCESCKKSFEMVLTAAERAAATSTCPTCGGSGSLLIPCVGTSGQVEERRRRAGALLRPFLALPRTSGWSACPDGPPQCAGVGTSRGASVPSLSAGEDAPQSTPTPEFGSRSLRWCVSLEQSWPAVSRWNSAVDFATVAAYSE